MARFHVDNALGDPGYGKRSSIERCCNMRLGQTVTATLVSFTLLGSASAQNLKEPAATVSSSYRLGKNLQYDIDGLKILVLSAAPNRSAARPGNLLWKELEDEGVELTFVKDKLQKYKLNYVYYGNF